MKAALLDRLLGLRRGASATGDTLELLDFSPGERASIVRRPSSSAAVTPSTRAFQRDQIELIIGLLERPRRGLTFHERLARLPRPAGAVDLLLGGDEAALERFRRQGRRQ
jgi:hypothetical protein